MSRKCLIERENKRKNLFESFEKKRKLLKEEKSKKSISVSERLYIQKELDSMPRNSSRIRQRNRCFITGRPRGFYRRFGVSRLMLRNLYSYGNLPGVTKSSW